MQQKTNDIGKQIYNATNGTLTRVFDCVSISSSAQISADAIGPAGGKYCLLLDEQSPRTDVERIFFLGYSVSGEEYIFEGEHFPADPEYFEHGVKFAQLADRLWAEGKLEPHPQRVLGGGLKGAIDGMRLMKEGKYSGEKLVYRLEETQWE